MDVITDQLQTDIHETKNHYSHHRIQLNVLKSNILRSRTYELNNLQLERDSLITQTELIKYNLFEQIQQYDHILNNYRVSLNTFRLTLTDLEQELKQQTDNELIQFEISNTFPRPTLNENTDYLVSILENKIEEKKSLNIQLGKTIENFQAKIFKQKQSLIKKENDYKTMEQIEQQLDQNINIFREISLQLKTERRSIERQLTQKLKQYSNDDRLQHTLIQQHDSLVARKKIEQIRFNSSNDRIESLIDENNRLKHVVEQLYRQLTQINPDHLLELQHEILRLQQTHQTLYQEKLLYQHAKHNYQNKDEQLQIKNNRIVQRIKNILIRNKRSDIDSKENYRHIQILENKLTDEQDRFLQLQRSLAEIKNRSESFRTKQRSIQMQTQIASNNIKHSQHHVKTFTEQLSVCRNDLNEQQISLNKLRDFHSVLKEQDEISVKKLSTIHNQSTSLQNQYKISIKSLQQISENLTKYSTVRPILGRMIVRRVNLCQLLYQKLARYDEYIHQREQSIEIISKCINSLKTQIRQIREQNKKCLERKDQIQLETVKIHMEKMLDHSHEKQRLLTKQIFQRRFSIKHSLKPLPFEDSTYLKNKFYLLKNRLIKMICRGILCHFVLISIQQEFANHLRYYTSKSNREKYMNSNSIRTNLYEIIQQLKAKSAENNMLIDFRYYFQIIHTDTIEQIVQWQNFNSTEIL